MKIYVSETFAVASWVCYISFYEFNEFHWHLPPLINIPLSFMWQSWTGSSVSSCHLLAVVENTYLHLQFSSVQFSSFAQLCPALCDPMNRSTPGLPVHHHLPEFTQTHVHQVRDAIQPSHPWSSPSPPAPNPSQHQSLFQWVNSSHEVAKVLQFQL